MDPEARERLAGRRLRLRDLVLSVAMPNLLMASSDIAEHSRCQPGRPRPNGASQAAPTCSSIGSARFQRAKSRGSSFAYSSLATRAPTFSSRRSSRDSRPYVGNFPIAKYTEPSSPLYATPLSSSCPTRRTIAGIASVARGYTCAGWMRR